MAAKWSGREECARAVAATPTNLMHVIGQAPGQLKLATLPLAI